MYSSKRGTCNQQLGNSAGKLPTLVAGRGRARGSARRSWVGQPEVGRHVAVVFAVWGQVICVEAVTALAVAAHVAALGVAVEPAPEREGASSTSPANACPSTSLEAFTPLEAFRRSGKRRQVDEKVSSFPDSQQRSDYQHAQQRYGRRLVAILVQPPSKKR
jgi:hypothetical protein